MAIKPSQNKNNIPANQNGTSPFIPFPEPQTCPGKWDVAALQTPCRPSTYGWQSQNQAQS